MEGRGGGEAQRVAEKKNLQLYPKYIDYVQFYMFVQKLGVVLLSHPKIGTNDIDTLRS
jgi:hypothetical protein